jgi:hypothetical protein
MGGKSDEMKAETFVPFTLAALVLIGGHIYLALTYHEPPIQPCGDFHNCRIIQIDTDGDSATYSAILTDTCRHGSLVHFKAEADRFNAGDTAQGNFFGQSK